MEDDSRHIVRWFKVWVHDRELKNAGLKRRFLKLGRVLRFKQLVLRGSLFQVLCGNDLADLLFGCTDEIPCCHRNQPWTPFNDVSRVARLTRVTSSHAQNTTSVKKKVLTGLDDRLTRVLDVSWQTCNVADTSDLLDALFLKSESSSAVASPLWSPCTTDSSTTEDPPTDPTESFPSSFCAGFPTADTPSFPPALECQPAPAQKNPYVSIDLGKTCFQNKNHFLEETGGNHSKPHHLFP